ncbi:hypothetical protein Angca_009438, partial [Angiostrongylus cantonensis]
FQSCDLSLLHACQCRDTRCRLLPCHRYKRVMKHVQLCKTRIGGCCLLYKRLKSL